MPVSVVLLVRALGRGFLDDLRRLLSAQAGGDVRRRPGRRLAPSPLVARVFGLRTEEGRAGFLLHAAASRSREARARVLPMLAMPVVFALVGLVGSDRSAMSLWAPYLAGASAATLWSLTAYHETPDASWLLAATPVRRYGQLVLGMAASIVVRQVLPAGAVVVALRVAEEPTWASLAGSLHGLLGSMLGLPIVLAGTKDVPFTQAFRSREGGRGWARALFVLLLAMLVLFAQMLLSRVAPWALWGTPVLFAVVLLAWTRAVAADLDVAPPPDLAPMRTAAA